MITCINGIHSMDSLHQTFNFSYLHLQPSLPLNSSFLCPTVYLNVSANSPKINPSLEKVIPSFLQTHNIALVCSQHSTQNHSFKDRSDCVHCSAQKPSMTSQLGVKAKVCNSLAGSTDLALYQLSDSLSYHTRPGPCPPSHTGLLVSRHLN